MAAIIVFMGPTGAGKSVQAERLVHERGMAHLSSGALLRADPQEAKLLATGQLVPSGEVEAIVGRAIAQVTASVDIILDGFPRALDEAAWLSSQLPTWGRRIDLVVLFDISRDMSTQRLLERQRADDSSAALDAKWREYEERTLPVVEYYRAQGLLRVLDGSGDADTVYAQLLDIMV